MEDVGETVRADDVIGGNEAESDEPFGDVREIAGDGAREDWRDVKVAEVVGEEEADGLDVIEGEGGERRNTFGGEERKEVVPSSAVSAS